MNDPKFQIVDGKLYSRDSGLVPDDEPVFVLRARDHHAAAAIRHYMQLVGNVAHGAAVHKRLVDFELFAADNPHRMKEPDTSKDAQR